MLTYMIIHGITYRLLPYSYVMVPLKTAETLEIVMAMPLFSCSSNSLFPIVRLWISRLDMRKHREPESVDKTFIIVDVCKIVNVYTHTSLSTLLGTPVYLALLLLICCDVHIQWWCNGVRKVYWQTLSLFIQINLCLNTSTYLSTVDHVHPFLPTINQSSKQKAPQTGFMNLIEINVLQWLSQSIQ